MKTLSRRNFIKLSGLAVAGATAGIAGLRSQAAASQPGVESIPGSDVHSDLSGDAAVGQETSDVTGHEMIMPDVNGEVDHAANGFDPTAILTDFDYGTVSLLPSGQTLREYEIIASDKDIEVVPGINFPAWVYNGRIPGPSLRANEGDRVRVHFINGSSHHHSIHFHGFHVAEMDGSLETIHPGESTIYEFDAEPFGLHLYHCHTPPLAKHIAKGLYGMFLIDPKEGRPPADHEFAMVMHGLDTDFDGVNDFYAVNGIPFHYQKHPINFKVGELVRIYLVNILEFDPINSMHVHASFFHYYPTGTSLQPAEFTDTIIQGQGQRGILELRYKYPGKYLFHAHVSEFAELGWTGFFQVEEA
jgi:FtsP/CotA-like multicopper oxidase with cupredoxin domain